MAALSAKTALKGGFKAGFLLRKEGEHPAQSCRLSSMTRTTLSLPACTALQCTPPGPREEHVQQGGHLPGYSTEEYTQGCTTGIYTQGGVQGEGGTLLLATVLRG